MKQQETIKGLALACRDGNAAPAQTNCLSKLETDADCKVPPSAISQQERPPHCSSQVTKGRSKTCWNMEPMGGTRSPLSPSPPPMLGTPHFSLNEALIMPLVMRRSPSLCCMERAAGEDTINLHIFCRDVGLLVLWLCQKTPLLFGIDFLFWPLLFSGLVKPRYLVTASISVCIQLMEFFCALYCYRLWIGSAFNTAFPHYPCEGENSYGPCFKAGKQSTNIKYQMTTKKGRLCWDLHRFYLCNTAKCWAHTTSRKK